MLGGMNNRVILFGAMLLMAAAIFVTGQRKRMGSGTANDPASWKVGDFYTVDHGGPYKLIGSEHDHTKQWIELRFESDSPGYPLVIDPTLHIVELAE